MSVTLIIAIIANLFLIYFIVALIAKFRHQDAYITDPDLEKKDNRRIIIGLIGFIIPLLIFIGIAISGKGDSDTLPPIPTDDTTTVKHP